MAPGTKKEARDMPWAVTLASAKDSEPYSHAELKNWSEHALGYIISYHCTRRLDETLWLSVDRLYAMSSDRLIEGTVGSAGLGEFMPAHFSNAPVRSLLPCQKGVIAERGSEGK